MKQNNDYSVNQAPQDEEVELDEEAWVEELSKIEEENPFFPQRTVVPTIPRQ